MKQGKEKYRIKNCPAFVKLTKQCRGIYDNNIQYQYCSGNSENCVIKQIVEKCKEHPFCDCACGDEILQLFDIEFLEDSEDDTTNNKKANN